MKISARMNAQECSTGKINLNLPRAGSKKREAFGTILAWLCVVEPAE